MAEHIILFDGVCNLCNAVVRFIIPKDKKGIFKFASLQSESGQTLLKRFNIPSLEFDSFIYISEGIAYQRSSAALRVARDMGGLWQLLYCFIIIPPFIRDGLYNIIARNRYRIFGKGDECMLPTEKTRERFLDGPKDILS